MEEKRYLTNEKLAEIRLNACRKRLIQKYPELSYALKGLTFQARSKKNGNPNLKKNPYLSTDGLNVYYSGKRIYETSSHLLEEQLMHIVLHGVLGHFQQQEKYRYRAYRDPLMDAQVAYVLEGMGFVGKKLERLQEMETLLDGDYSMKQYYRALGEPKLQANLERIASTLSWDDHSEWNYKRPTMEELRASMGGEQQNNASGNHQAEVKKFWSKAREYVVEDLTEDSWKQIREQLVDAPGKSGQYGNNAGKREAEYRLQEGRGRSYEELLRELFSVREVVQEQPDTIDPMYYHYGLEMYGDVPLVEPLEYGEARSFDLIVIAVDVSGSCTNEQVMGKFWKETYSFLSQIREAYGAGDLLILQCDTKIQEERWIGPEDELERPDKVRVFGFGGTSFVPVFERIEVLEKENRKVDALFYLTDGAGEYPEKKPEYPVYFVMEERDYDWVKKMQRVPDWIEMVKLEGD